jgi:hypothetical protein
MVNGQPAETGQALARLVQFLGDDFVRYVLSIPDHQTLADIELSTDQQQVAQILDNQFMPRGVGNSDATHAYLQIQDLSGPAAGGDSSMVNALREATGGRIEQVDPRGESFIDAMTALARDVWPIYLVRPRGEGPRTFWMSAPFGVYRSPAFSAAIEAFLADSRLIKLFPYPPSPEDAGGEDNWSRSIRYQSLIVSNSHGGSLQLSSLVPNLLTNAVFRCLIAEDKLSLKTLVPHLVAATEDLRDLADGNTVSVPALVGLAGVVLPGGCVLDLPDGRLRPANTADWELFMAGTDSLTTVLETTFPMKIYSVSEHKFDDGTDPFKDFARFQTRISEATRSFAHKVDHIRLSLFLASPPEEPWLAREVARYIPDSLAHGGISSWDPGFASVPTFELGEDHFDRVREWHALVKDKNLPSLDIGMRRLLSASTMRTDPIDAFVDAVICWENLFGVQTETTFRVTGSVAKLLEPSNLSKREVLYKELKDLYSKRSRLVHGGAEPRPEDIAEYRQRAIDVAADCFRVLYRDRADLLELPSDARAARLLLE